MEVRLLPRPFDAITDFIFVETPLLPADVIMIPGSSRVALIERTAELYRRYLAPWVLPSGGTSLRLSGYRTEWEFMSELACSLSIPPAAILKEDQARSTFDNARYSRLAVEEKGIKVSRIILVCKAWHARRALMTYQTEFPHCEFYLAPVADQGISRHTWHQSPEGIKLVMTELEKIGKYFGPHIINWADK